MKWFKYVVRKGKEATFLRLPVGEDDILESAASHEVVTLAFSFCECSLVDAFEKGNLIVNVVGDVEDWATTDLSDHEQPWATNVSKRYYAPTLRDESEAQVNTSFSYFLLRNLDYF